MVAGSARRRQLTCPLTLIMRPGGMRKRQHCDIFVIAAPPDWIGKMSGTCAGRIICCGAPLGLSGAWLHNGKLGGLENFFVRKENVDLGDNTCDILFEFSCANADFDVYCAGQNREFLKNIDNPSFSMRKFSAIIWRYEWTYDGTIDFSNLFRIFPQMWNLGTSRVERGPRSISISGTTSFDRFQPNLLAPSNDRGGSHRA
jgi:hypothetical protein